MPKPVEIELLMVDKTSAKLKIAGKEVDNLRVKVGGANAALKQTEKQSDRLTASIKKLTAAFTIREIVKNVTTVRGEFQQLEVAFNTMLGSAEKADALMKQLTRTAATTPFEMKDVAQGAKQLLAYGFEADKVNATLIRLGDVAAGLSIPLNDLVYLYGTTMAQGRLYTQDLNQFTNRGIPMIAELAKQFGVAESEVKSLVEAGKVGFPEVQKVIESLTNEGGKFGGLMEEQSNTIIGQISNIEDAIDMMLNDIGKSNEGFIQSTLSGVSYMVEHYERFGRILLSLAATYGTYRAAVMLVTAAEGAETAMKAVGILRTNLLTKAQVLLNATMLSNPYVLVATALSAVVGVMLSAKSETEQLQEATDEYNDSLSKTIQKEEEHKRRIDELVSIASDEALSTDTRREALNKLEQHYPHIFTKYDTEYDKLKHIRDIKLEIAKFEEEQSMANTKNQKKEVECRIQELEEKAKTSTSTTMNTSAGVISMTKGGLTSKETAELKMLRKKKNELTDSIDKENAQAYFANLTGVSNEQLEVLIKERKNLLASMKVNKKDEGTLRIDSKKLSFSKDELDYQLNKLRSERNARYAPRYSSAQFYKEAKTAYEDALKAYNSFVSNANNKLTKGEFAEQAKKLKDNLNEAKKQLSKLSPEEVKKKHDKSKSLEKTAKEEQKLEEQRLKEKEKLQQRSEDLALRLEQSRIDNLQDGFEKRKSQIALNAEKERILIMRQKEKTISEMKKNGKFSAEQIKDAEGMYDGLLRNTAMREEVGHLNELLAKYQGFYAKRLDIEARYEQQKKLLKAKGADETVIDELEYQKDQELNSLDEEYAQRQEGFSQWVNRLSELSLNALRELLTATEKELSELERKDPQSAKLATLRTKVREIKQSINHGKAFAPDNKGLEGWKTLFQVLGQTRDELNNLGIDANSSIGQMMNMANTIATSTIAMIGGIQKIGSAAAASLSAVEKASVILGIISAAIQITHAISQLTDKLANLNYSKAVEKYNEINQLKDQVNEYRLAVQKAREEEEKWFSEDNLRGLKTLRKRHEEITRQYYEKMNQVEAKYRNKSSGLSNVWKFAKIPAEMFAMGIFSAPLVGKHINDILKDRPDLTTARNNLRVQTRHRTFFRSEKTKNLEQYLKDKGFGDLFDEQGLINRELAEHALKNLRLVGNTKDTLEKLVKLREEYDEYQKQLREYVNTLYSPLVDNFVDAIWTQLQTGKDALDSFKEYASDTFAAIAKDMIKSLVLSQIVGEGEKSFKNKMVKLHEEFAKGGLTEKELIERRTKLIQELMDTAQSQLPQITETANAYKDALKSIGIDLGGGVSQHGKEGGFSAMTQDQGTKLEGLFTSGLQHWSSMDAGIEEVRDKMNVAESHLAHIDENTSLSAAHLHEIKESIRKMIRDGLKMK